MHFNFGLLKRRYVCLSLPIHFKHFLKRLLHVNTRVLCITKRETTGQAAD